MTSYILAEEESTYCLGISRFDFGLNLYYHGGFWGTGVTYSPDTKSSVAVFTLEKGKRNEINPFLGKTIQEY
jgi:CubicO group peptidase (beta-lactamase class C family)